MKLLIKKYDYYSFLNCFTNQIASILKSKTVTLEMLFYNAILDMDYVYEEIVNKKQPRWFVTPDCLNLDDLRLLDIELSFQSFSDFDHAEEFIIGSLGIPDITVFITADTFYLPHAEGRYMKFHNHELKHTEVVHARNENNYVLWSDMCMPYAYLYDKKILADSFNSNKNHLVITMDISKYQRLNNNLYLGKFAAKANDHFIQLNKNFTFYEKIIDILQFQQENLNDYWVYIKHALYYIAGSRMLFSNFLTLYKLDTTANQSQEIATKAEVIFGMMSRDEALDNIKNIILKIKELNKLEIHFYSRVNNFVM